MTWVLLAAGAVAAYAVSLRLFPYRNCWWCKGGKASSDKVFTGAFRDCWICRGRGYRMRWGVVVFRRRAYRDIKDGWARRDRR